MKIFFTRTTVILLAFILGSAFGAMGGPAVLAASGPDLIIDKITLSPTEPALGNDITIIIAVKNQGDTTAESSHVTCYVDDAIIKTEAIGYLAPGISTTILFTWTAVQGEHTIKAIADAGGKITESNENNNMVTYAITTVAPDLLIQSITYEPLNASKGDNVIFSITIKNQGSYRSFFTSLDFQIDGSSRGIFDVPAIEPGETTVVRHNWIALTDQHIFKAIIDVNNNTRESNENNNELSIVFNTLLPDLIIETIDWTPKNPSKDDIVSFNATIKNQGTGRADSCALAYYIDDVFINTITVPVLNAGASCNTSFSWKAELNAHEIRVMVDYYQMVIENIETNNEMRFSLLTAPPDLMVSNLTWQPEEPAAGNIMTFTVTVKNQGSGNAEPSRAVVYINNKTYQYLDYPLIPAGQEQSLEFEWTAESGVYTISIKADYAEKVTETKEDNNRKSATFTVTPPDLVVTGISYLPVKPAIGDTVSFNITIKNQGKGLSSSFKAGYYLDNDMISVGMVNSLAYNESVNVFCKWKVTNGHHVFRVNVDDGNSVWESNEKNNTFAINIAPNMPDLSITNIVWQPAEITPGQEVIFTIDIENIGGINAGVSRLVYYVDGDIAGFNDIEPVTAGAKTTQTFIWAASEGRHSISIVADSKGQITEIDEMNNTVIVNIPPPDLTVPEVRYAGQGAMTGDTVTIIGKILNERGSRTEAAVAGCYVDGISIGLADIPALEAGESAEVSFTWTAEPGIHIFKIHADINKSVMEVDEANNEGSITFTTTTPDLFVESIRWLTNKDLSNNEVNITIVLKNGGGCDSGPFSIKYSFDDENSFLRDMASIPGNAIAELNFTAILSEGEHTLHITVDTENDVSEANEDNNRRDYSFATDAPDLVIRSITWSPLTAGIGEAVTISAKIENIGATLASNIRVALTIDGVEAGFADITEISPGATVAADFPWTALEGEHEILIYADAGQSVAEGNETNNSRSRTVAFLKAEPPGTITPVLDLGAATGAGLLDTWWWIFLAAGGILGVFMLYTTIKNMRKR